MVTVTLPDDGDSQVDISLPRATGAAATIAVGTVTEGTPLSIVNSGTATAAVFDFVIPAGGGGGGVTPPFPISYTTGLQTALDGKQPLDADLTAIATLTTTSYGRGLLTLADVGALKTSLTLAKGDVGLGNVDNTSDAAKPVSTAQQTALNLKANLASPTFTGTPTAPTASNGTNTTQIATTAFVLANAGGGGGGAPLGNYTATTAPTANDDSADGYAVGSRWFNTVTSQMWTARVVTVGAAFWVLEDLADHPGYISGNWYHGNTGVALANGATLAANTVRMIPFVFKTRVTISALATRITTASSGGNIQLAIYDHNSATGFPTGPARATTASISTTATGPQPSTGAPLVAGDTTFEAGIYWLAVNSDNSTAVCQAYAAAQVVAGYMIGSPVLSDVTGAGTTGILALSVASQTFGTWNDFTSAPFTRIGANSYTIPIFKVA